MNYQLIINRNSSNTSEGEGKCLKVKVANVQRPLGIQNKTHAQLNIIGQITNTPLKVTFEQCEARACVLKKCLRSQGFSRDKLANILLKVHVLTVHNSHYNTGNYTALLLCLMMWCAGCLYPLCLTCHWWPDVERPIFQSACSATSASLIGIFMRLNCEPRRQNLGCATNAPPH